MSSRDLYHRRINEMRESIRSIVKLGDQRERRERLTHYYRLCETFEIEDGQRMHYEALAELYQTSPQPANRRTAPQGEGEITCRSCGKGFGSVAALSGHGPERCAAKKKT